MDRYRSTIIKWFWGIFSLSMLLILTAAITRPLNNLVPGRMVLYTLAWMALWAGIWFFLCRLEKRCKNLDALVRIGRPIFLLLFGGALFVVSHLLRSDLITDYQAVYETAYALATGEGGAQWEYFARWNNNLGCMVILSLLFRVSRAVQETADPYSFVLFCNVVQVTAVVYCVSYLAGRTVRRHPSAASLMALAAGALWIPFWANSSVFYSDQLSLGAGIFVVTLLVEGQGRKREFLYDALAGVILGVGITIKATVGTALIALAAVSFLSGRLRKDWKKLAVLTAGALLVMFSFSLYFRELPCQKDVERLKVPVEYWIALGLGENGTYSSSEEFAVRCLTAENVYQRREIAREQIRSRYTNFWDPRHLVKKARQNFGCGDFGAAGYLLYREDENLLWNWFSQEGRYYWKHACLSTSFFFSILAFLAVGGWAQVVCGGGSGKNPLFLAAAMAFWGLCLFLMLWEAQDKQLYNHSTWLMLSLLYSLDAIGGLKRNARAGRGEDSGEKEDDKQLTA